MWDEGLTVMMDLDVRAHVRGATRYLGFVHRRQIPFATSMALNDTAFQVRKRIVERTYPRAFNVRNRRFPDIAFRVRKASKRKLRASVYDRLGRASLGLHAEGGTKRPRGRHLAVPGSNVKRTATGKVGKARQPRTVLSRGKAFKVRRGRGEMIFERIGSKGKKLKLLYVLTPSARNDKRFPFHKDAMSTATRAFPRNFDRALARAIATARP